MKPISMRYVFPNFLEAQKWKHTSQEKEKSLKLEESQDSDRHVGVLEIMKNVQSTEANLILPMSIQNFQVQL